MSDYIRSDLKIKQADGTFKKYSPTVTLDSIITGDDTLLSTKLINNGTKYTGTAANAEKVPWSGVQNTPTTVDGYGITELPANKLSGTIPIENLPHGALERCVVVQDTTDMYKLTSDEIQNGDTVKVNSTGKMYFVVDDTKLNSLNSGDAFEEYVVGIAGAVYWSSVLNRPSTVEGYGITNAIKSSDVVSEPIANKLLKLDSTGKFPMSSIPQHIEFTTYTLADIT